MKGENKDSRKGAARAPHDEKDPTHVGSDKDGVRFKMPSGKSPMTEECCPDTSGK